MPKSKDQGWKSSLYGELYLDRDQRLIGMGNPPCDPEFSLNNPGQGLFPLDRCVIEINTSTDGKVIILGETS